MSTLWLSIGGLWLFTIGAWWGSRQEHGNWLNSARVGTSQRGRDGVFYRVEAEKP